MEVKFLTRKNIENVIQDAKNLEKIVLPSQIKTIGAGTFSNYKNLKEINLNNGLIEIGQRAFANSNIETIIVPPSVVRISSSAFSECENLEKVTFLGELKKVSDGMFDGCKNLKVIDFPFETESIGMYSFRGCKSLKFLNLPNSIKEIGSYAFKDSGIEGLSCSYDTIIRPMAFIGTNIFYIYNTKDKLIFSKNLINYMDTAKCLDFSKLKYLKDFDIINPYLHQNNQKINDFIEQINKEKIIYIDPYKIEENYNDADIIFLTHDHYDHYSEEDIDKVINKNTIIVIPEEMIAKLLRKGIDKNSILVVKPNEEYMVQGIKFETIPSYNVNKKFHPKENNWVGYIITIDEVRYYIAGDTDITEENRKVKCDVAFVPVGGTYTMSFEEAAQLINEIKPQVAVPIHYGSVVGTKQDAIDFIKLLNPTINGVILMK